MQPLVIVWLRRDAEVIIGRGTGPATESRRPSSTETSQHGVL